MQLRTGHTLGWIRYSQFGGQGYIITRDAARRFLDLHPLATPPLDRALPRYWSHGLMVYGVRPPIVVHDERRNPDYRSLIKETPVVNRRDSLRTVRHGLFHTKDGLRKRIAFFRYVARSHGPFRAVREVLGPRPLADD